VSATPPPSSYVSDLVSHPRRVRRSLQVVACGRSRPSLLLRCRFFLPDHRVSHGPVPRTGGDVRRVVSFRGSFGVLDSGRKDVAYEDFRGHKLDREMLDLLRSM